eukprot:GHVU01217437.1.p1 GENE.GHVU01217437.1~~GHVU01217437.1.p1  ORF type:complete len:243 (+),score=46.92 GHVU01217437.1:128-856(+)
MKLNIANPKTGLQKILNFDDEKHLVDFYDKRMGSKVLGDKLGDEFKGYVFRISGGNDKQGFPMMQGVLLPKRCRLLFKKGMKTFRPRRKGQQKRKSVRGCIVGADLSVLNLVVERKGDADVPGLTDSIVPLRLAPKRASKIRRMWNLSKDDDVKKYVVRVPKKGGKQKAPKIQRLVTADRLQRKRRVQATKVKKAQKSRAALTKYMELTNKVKTARRETRAKDLAKKKPAPAGKPKEVAAKK